MTAHAPSATHLVPLGSGGWSLWRWIWVRGAGFAARRVLAIGSDDIVAEVEALQAAEARVAEAETAAHAACDAAQAAGQGAPMVQRVKSRLGSRGAPLDPTDVPEVDGAVRALVAARQELAKRRASTTGVIERERGRLGEALRAEGRDPLFREALIWQNRAVLHNAVDTLLDDDPTKDNTKTRERQRLIAKYLQRYTMKNESIGFFGPSAWGSFDADKSGFEVIPGPSLVSARAVCFESWSIDEIAAMLSERPEVAPIFKPRLKPLCWVDGNTLHVPTATPRTLTPAEAFLLAAADGSRTAKQLAEAAAATAASGLASIADGLRELTRLGQQGMISWAIEIPVDLEHPQVWLRQELSQLDDAEARARALEPLDRLDTYRVALAACATKPEALVKAVEELESVFRDITSMSSKRGFGKAYAGRQLFYEDCTRALDLVIGRRFLDELDAPMTLLLDSARWFTYEIAQRFRVAIEEEYQKLVATTGAPEVPLGALLVAAKDLFPIDQYNASAIVTEVQAELQRRWHDVLALERLDLSQPVLRLASADLRARAAERFDAPGPGWPRARYHAPDMMISGASVDAVARGDYEAVLGELHCGTNTLLARAAYRLHPDRESVKAAWDADQVEVGIAPVQASASRATHPPVTDRDLHVELNWARSWRPRDHVHSGGDLYVVREDRGLMVRSRKAPLAYDIVAFLEHYLCASAAPHFNILAKRPHLPRVVIDKLVVSRERWHFPQAEFAELLEPTTPVAQIEVVLRWARTRRLPRFVFGKVPHEAKPFYVDFGSPVLVDVFVRHLKAASALGLSELLPAHDRLWLHDADGQVFTSELRFAAVDPRPWAAPPHTGG